VARAGAAAAVGALERERPATGGGAGDSAYRSAPQPRDWSTWVLWAVLVAGAALVTQFALRLVRSHPSDPPPDA